MTDTPSKRILVRAFLGWLAVVAAVIGTAWIVTAQAQSLGAPFRDSVLNETFRGVAYTPPGTLYVGLSSTPCGTATVGTEPTSGYTRTAVVSATSTWSAPSAGTISNSGAITFTPSATWGTMTHYFIADGPTSGAGVVICHALTTPKYVNSGDSLSFPPGSLTVTLQ